MSSALAASLVVDRVRARRVVIAPSEPGGNSIASGTVWAFRVLGVLWGGALLLSLYFLATWAPVLMVVSFVISRFLLWIWEVLATRLVRLIALRDQGFLAVGLKSRLVRLEPPGPGGVAAPDVLGSDRAVTVTITMPEKLVPLLADLAERWGFRVTPGETGVASAPPNRETRA